MDYYNLTPKVTGPGFSGEFRLRSRYETKRLRPGAQFKLRIRSLDDFTEVQELSIAADRNSEIRFEFSPKTLGEYQVLMHPADNPHRATRETAFFVVPSELSALRPFRGDLHMHTWYSDGRESPGYMAAHARELGMDFAAVTDHREYEPSLEAIKRADELNMDILLFPGEEINYQLGLGHIVSINAAKSISDDIRGKGKSRRELTQTMAKEVEAELNDLQSASEEDRQLLGYYYAVVRRIRQAGGLAIAAHPFWVSQGTYDLARRTYEAVLKNRLVDAVEVFGDQGFEKNVLSMMRINEHLRDHTDMPLVGSSDAHNAHQHNMGEIWTLAFADKLTRESVLEAIRQCRTVPCLKEAGGGQVVAYGPTDLVEYSYFLLREFFPLHDEICSVLGGLYKGALRSGRPVPEAAQLQLELSDLYDQCFAQ